MSGLVLAAALCAVVFFVVSVKYTETMILGIPSGEVAVFIMIEMIMTGMLAVYCRNMIGARNVLLWFLVTGIAAWILSLAEVEILGLVYFLSAIGVAIAYCLILMIKFPTRKNIGNYWSHHRSSGISVFGQHGVQRHPQATSAAANQGVAWY